MSQRIRKLKILFMLLRSTFEDWRRAIWRRDLNDKACCDGRDCGCGGATIAEVYESR